MVDLDDPRVPAALVLFGTLEVPGSEVGEELVDEVHLFDGAVGVGFRQLFREEARHLSAGVKAGRKDPIAFRLVLDLGYVGREVVA